MKFKTTLISAVALSFLAVAYMSAQYISKKGLKEKEARHEGMEDDANERMNYELRRYADPATGKIPDNVRQKELAFAATLPNDAEGSRSNPLVFVNRGPWNVGGRTRAFGVDVSNENRLLAGSCSGGMWLSTDGGTTWNMSNTAGQLKNASCLVQDKRPNHTNVWYYGSGEAYGASASGSGSNSYYLGDGLFKSIDGGVSWQPITTTSGGNPGGFTTGWQLVWGLANDVSAPDTSSVVYAAIYGGVYKTSNGGTSWAAVKTGGSYFTNVEVDTAGVVYITMSDDGGSGKGIWRSANGTTFTKITPPNFPTAYNRIVSGINPNNRNEVYFMANTPGSGKEVFDYLGKPHWNSLWKYTYLSGNGDSAGGVWQDLSINLPKTGSIFDHFQTQDSYDMVVKVKPGNSNVVYLGGTNVYRSTSAFQDSTHTTFIGGYEQNSHLPVINTYLNHHPDQHCMEFLPSNPDVMFSANDGGVFKTTNDTAVAVSWQSLNNGYLTTMFYTVAIDHATPNNDIIIGGAQDQGSWYTNSSNPQVPWVTPRSGDGSYCAIADNQSNYYFSIQQGKMMKATLDGSGNITSYARIDPQDLKKPEFINPYTLDPNNNDIMYLAGGKYLWRNSNLAGIPMINNWDSINTNWTRFNDSVPTVSSVVTAVTVCKIPANRVYYGTDNKRIYRVDNANAGTPTPVDITSTATSAVFPAGGYVSCIATDPRDGNKLMAIFSNYSVYSIFYSTDGGTSWAKAGGNLEVSGAVSPSIRWASIIPVADGTVYMVATSTGLYATDTLTGISTTWVQQGTNSIGNAVCDMIDYRTSDGLVVIATHANGIYSTHVTSVNDILGVQDLAGNKKEMQLSAYPNPMNLSSTIEFTINKKSKVNLEIWDECGRIVETLADENMSEGKHSVVFDRKNLQAGIYYYSLTADNNRKTKKLVLVK